MASEHLKLFFFHFLVFFLSFLHYVLLFSIFFLIFFYFSLAGRLRGIFCAIFPPMFSGKLGFWEIGILGFVSNMAS